jgi:hypothetical protein
MTYEEIRPWGYFDPQYRRVKIGLFKRTIDGKRFSAAPVQWTENNPNDSSVEYPPLLSLDPEIAQLLINSLWDAGMRPVQANGSAGQLQATEKHLADMQKITSQLLGKVLE